MSSLAAYPCLPSNGSDPGRPMKSSASASRFKPYRDVLVYSIPATTSLLIEMLTSLTDALFAGNLPVGGTEALSAITLASPVFGIAMALQSIFAMPVAVLVARHHRDRDERDRYLSLSIVLSIAVTCAASAITLLGLDGIVGALGARGRTAEMLRTYLAVQSLSNVVSALGFTLTTAIRALGRPVTETVITTASVAVNIALNIVLAFWLNMGVAGLALATLGSEVCCAGASAACLARSHSLPKIARAFDDGCARRSGEIIGLGIAQGGPQILSSITGAAMNSAMAAGGMGRVAAWGAAQRVYSVAIMPLVGISQGAQTHLAREAEADVAGKGTSGEHAVIRLSCFTGAILTALVLFFGRAVCAPLAPEPSVLDLASRYCSACCITLVPLGVAQALTASSIARGNSREAITVCIARQTALILAIGIARTLTAFPVVMSVPLADVAAALVAMAMRVSQTHRPLKSAAI